jgi:2-phospho-L-lactate/phosphoenolpyruvate guanylyltransferase
MAAEDRTPARPALGLPYAGAMAEAPDPARRSALGSCPAAVLVPVKAFAAAKVRLAPALGPIARAELARRMAGVVLDAAGGLPAVIVCDDDEVRSWAAARGTRVIWTPGLGLDGAVQAGVEQLGAEGCSRVVVAHGDLPLATELAWVADFPGVTLVPDRRFDGTNVACVPTDAGFRFAYGPGSFGRHRAEARRLGLVTRLVADHRLGWDVDLPDDLDLPVGT